MVEISNVSKTFGQVKAVNGVNLTVPRGNFLTIVGPSGCGKTTLLHMIAGFQQPSTGAVLLNGSDVADVPPYLRSIGIVFQKLALFPHMTAAQNVTYPLKMRRFDVEEIPDRVSKYLKLVKLEGLGGRRPHELSGGQQQRVAIARALSFNPDLLLLDEPLSALDKKLREEMQLEFRRIQQELGVTTINVTHDQREALVMSDQIVVMNDGVVQQTGTPVDIYQRPQNVFVTNFIGVTSMFKGQVLRAEDDCVTVKVGGTLLTARVSDGRYSAGSEVECAIRAENLRIILDHDNAFANTVEGVVSRCIFEGDRMVYEVTVDALDGSKLWVFDNDVFSHNQHEVSKRIRIGWKASDLFAFPAMQSK